MMNNVDMSEQKDIMPIVWRLLDVLRGDLNSEDHSVILLFLFVRATGLYPAQAMIKGSGVCDYVATIQKEVDQLDVLSTENDLLFAIDKSSLNKVIANYRDELERMNKGVLENVLFEISMVDPIFLREHIENIFEQIIPRISIDQSRSTLGAYSQPKALTSLINGYVNKAENLNIFNPFSGNGSFILGYPNAKNILAQELHQRTWAIGQLRLFVNTSKATFKCEDSLLNWPKEERFDLVVSYPPFGFRLNQRYLSMYPDVRNAEDFLLKYGVEALSAKGKLVAVFTQGALFRGGTSQKIREKLVHDDVIDTVISFPGGLLNHTGISFVILVIDKAKTKKGKIRLVDASNFVAKLNVKERIIQSDSLLKVLESYQDSAFMRIIDNNDIISNDYNLSVLRYFQEEIGGVKLGELLKSGIGKRVSTSEDGKFVGIRDLKKDEEDFLLNSNDILHSNLSKKQVTKIGEPCLLLAGAGNSLKPTYFDGSGEPIYTWNKVYAFSINDSRIDIEYMVNELRSEYVNEQLHAFGAGSVQSFIRQKDILQITIKLPSIEEQRAKVAGLKEISERMDALKAERNALAHGLKTKEFNEFASLKHTLGRPRQNILSWSKNLKRFFEREKGGISSMNMQFKELYELDLLEAISEINRDIKFISEVLEKGENGLILEDFPKRYISLPQLTKTLKELSSNGYKFSIERHLLNLDAYKNIGVFINENLFKTLLDNILTNANKYGFKEKKVGNVVQIELTEVDDVLIMDIRNNGLPFPKNFDRNKFITKYSTADSENGTGLGGYDVNRIATYFENKDWELILNEDPIYPVIFRFAFPIKRMN